MVDIIKNYEDLEPFKDHGARVIRFEGAVEFKCSISVPGDYIEAGWSIEAGGSIEARDYIKAGGYIKARGNIKAGGYIFSYMFNISAKVIISKLLPFGRHFWADMPPLKKWRSQILDKSKCWDDLRAMPTPDEANEICAWEGWHPILKCQLEMFFGLKEQCIWNEDEQRLKEEANDQSNDYV
jgi:hypothetical protein